MMNPKSRLSLLLALSIAGIGVTVAPSQHRDVMPTPRYGFCTAVLNDSVFVIGGAHPMQAVRTDIDSTVEAFDPRTGTWNTQLRPLSGPRVFAAAVVVDGRIFVFGGMEGISPRNSRYLSSVEMFDPGVRRWFPRSPMPTPRAKLAAAVVNGKVLLIGGEDSSGPLDVVEEYDPDHDAWNTHVDHLRQRRMGFSAFTIDDDVYVVGGIGGPDPPNPLRSMEKFNTHTNPRKWEMVSSLNLTVPRAFYGGVVTDKAIIVLGGEGFAGFLSTAEVFSIKDDKPLPSSMYFLPFVRSMFGCVLVRDRLYVFGGLTYAQQLAPSIYELDLVTGINEAYPEIPASAALYQNYPNPFNPATTITYDIPAASDAPVVMEVFSVLGDRVALIQNLPREPGRHSIVVDAGRLPSGTYLYKLTRGKESISRRMALVK